MELKSGGRARHAKPENVFCVERASAAESVEGSGNSLAKASQNKGKTQEERQESGPSATTEATRLRYPTLLTRADR